MRKYGTTWGVFFLLLVLVVFVFSLTSIHRGTKLTYSDLQVLMQQAQGQFIKNVVISNDDPIVQVKTAGAGDQYQQVLVPKECKEQLIRDLVKAHIPLEVKEPDKAGFWFSMISSFFLPILLLVGFLFMFRSAQGSGRSSSIQQVLANFDNRISSIEAEIRALRIEIAATRKGADLQEEVERQD